MVFICLIDILDYSFGFNYCKIINRFPKNVTNFHLLSRYERQLRLRHLLLFASLHQEGLQGKEV